jgi:hypothetical protein
MFWMAAYDDVPNKLVTEEEAEDLVTKMVNG